MVSSLVQVKVCFMHPTCAVLNHGLAVPVTRVAAVQLATPDGLTAATKCGPCDGRSLADARRRGPEVSVVVIAHTVRMVKYPRPISDGHAGYGTSPQPPVELRTGEGSDRACPSHSAATAVWYAECRNRATGSGSGQCFVIPVGRQVQRPVAQPTGSYRYGTITAASCGSTVPLYWLLSEGCVTHVGTFKGVVSPHSPLVGLFKTLHLQ
jgi:hypothetical protein